MKGWHTTMINPIPLNQSLVIELDSPMLAMVNFKQTLDTLVDGHAKNHFIFDFSRVEEINSDNVGMLFAFYNELQLVGGILVFAAIPSHIAHLFQRCHLDLIIEQAPTVEAADELLRSKKQRQSMITPLFKSARKIGLKIVERIIFKLILSITECFFKLLCRGKFEGLDAINKRKADGFILAANHVSYLDWLILWQYMYRKHDIKLTFLAKEKLFTHKLWGGVMRSADCIMVSNDGKRILDPLGQHRLASAKYIGIFPEGERSRSGQIQGAKPGVIKIAKQLNKLIIPVGLKGFYEVWPPNQKIPLPHKCEVNIGKAFDASIQPSKEGLDVLMTRIAALTGEISHAA